MFTFITIVLCYLAAGVAVAIWAKPAFAVANEQVKELMGGEVPKYAVAASVVGIIALWPLMLVYVYSNNHK